MNLWSWTDRWSASEGTHSGLGFQRDIEYVTMEGYIATPECYNVILECDSRMWQCDSGMSHCDTAMLQCDSVTEGYIAIPQSYNAIPEGYIATPECYNAILLQCDSWMLQRSANIQFWPTIKKSQERGGGFAFLAQWWLVASLLSTVRPLGCTRADEARRAYM